MAEIIDCARALGEAITESIEFKCYMEAKALIEDLKLNDRVIAYERAEEVLKRDNLNKESKLYNDALEILNKENSGEVLSYVKTKKELGALLNDVNTTLSYITGLETGTAGCGGCGGCSGCR